MEFILNYFFLNKFKFLAERIWNKFLSLKDRRRDFLSKYIIWQVLKKGFTPVYIWRIIRYLQLNIESLKKQRLQGTRGTAMNSIVFLRLCVTQFLFKDLFKGTVAFNIYFLSFCRDFAEKSSSLGLFAYKENKSRFYICKFSIYA